MSTKSKGDSEQATWNGHQRDETLPITVVVPTIGRPALLASCLQSITACRPRAEQVIVVDQSGGRMAEIVAAHAGTELLICDGIGIATGTNLGLRAASHHHVIVTHDDCTVSTDWIARAVAFAAAWPNTIVTGRVLPAGDRALIPGTTESTAPIDYTGIRAFGVLSVMNMLLPRHAVLDLGGFDQRATLRRAGEDNDFCYRWLKTGRSLRYQPELVVWHHEWRSREELERLWVVYARGEGAFYAKHLAEGDLRILPIMAFKLALGVRSSLAGLVLRRPASGDYQRGFLRGIPQGLVAGLKEGRQLRSAGSASPAA